MRSSRVLPSLTTMFLETLASRSETHGPVRSARCRVPIWPAPGLVNAWLAKGAPPSGPTASPSVVMSDWAAMKGPLPVFRTWNRLFNCPSDRLVSAVSLPERALRLSVPRPDRMEYGEPVCQVRMPATFHPPTSFCTTRLPGLKCLLGPNGSFIESVGLEDQGQRIAFGT